MKVSIWIRTVSTLISLLGLFVGCSLYLSPENFVNNVEFSATGVPFLIMMWASRQISIAVIIGFSVFKNSAQMLKISLIAYFLMIFQDIFIGIFINDSGLIYGSAFFSIISFVMIIFLFRNNSENRN